MTREDSLLEAFESNDPYQKAVREEKDYANWFDYSWWMQCWGFILGFSLIFISFIFILAPSIIPTSFSESGILELLRLGLLTIGVSRRIVWHSIRILFEKSAEFLAEKFLRS